VAAPARAAPSGGPGDHRTPDPRDQGRPRTARYRSVQGRQRRLASLLPVPGARAGAGFQRRHGAAVRGATAPPRVRASGAKHRSFCGNPKPGASLELTPRLRRRRRRRRGGHASGQRAICRTRTEARATTRAATRSRSASAEAGGLVLAPWSSIATDRSRNAKLHRPRSSQSSPPSRAPPAGGCGAPACRRCHRPAPPDSIAAFVPDRGTAAGPVITSRRGLSAEHARPPAAAAHEQSLRSTTPAAGHEPRTECSQRRPSQR
jgi:hypothetical protein